MISVFELAALRPTFRRYSEAVKQDGVNMLGIARQTNRNFGINTRNVIAHEKSLMTLEMLQNTFSCLRWILSNPHTIAIHCVHTRQFSQTVIHHERRCRFID